MKTLYLTRGNNMVVDTETNTVDRLDTERQAIDYIYLIKEPIHIVYGHGDIHQEMDAKEGDIIITFYDKVFKNQCIAVNSSEWNENILEYRKKEQEEKERWAAENKACCDCEACPTAA